MDVLETVTGSPSQHKAVKEEEENKIKEKEEQLETKPLLIQQVTNFSPEKKNESNFYRFQFILTLETIEIKLQVGLGSGTKSVVAMCLSNLTEDVKNWSTDVSLSSTVNLEAALFNERILAWEPLIEPTIDASGAILSPWCIACSIVPVSLHSEYVLQRTERSNMRVYSRLLFISLWKISLIIYRHSMMIIMLIR